MLKPRLSQPRITVGSQLNCTDSSVEEVGYDSGAKARRKIVISNNNTAKVDKNGDRKG
jgi:hypothetical protein